jgi:hypothetical protein
MVVPKGWWLQDRRSDATLFSAAPAPTASTYRATRPRRRPVALPPLPLDNEPDAAPSVVAPAWTPACDAADDLDGLLVAKTPLLSRAFRQAAPARPQS